MKALNHIFEFDIMGAKIPIGKENEIPKTDILNFCSYDGTNTKTSENPRENLRKTLACALMTMCGERPVGYKQLKDPGIAKDMYNVDLFEELLELVQKAKFEVQSSGVLTRRHRRNFWSESKKGAYEMVCKTVLPGNNTISKEMYADLKKIDDAEVSDWVSQGQANALSNLIAYIEDKTRDARELAGAMPGEENHKRNKEVISEKIMDNATRIESRGVKKVSASSSERLLLFFLPGFEAAGQVLDVWLKYTDASVGAISGSNGVRDFFKSSLPERQDGISVLWQWHTPTRMYCFDGVLRILVPMDKSRKFFAACKDRGHATFQDGVIMAKNLPNRYSELTEENSSDE